MGGGKKRLNCGSAGPLAAFGVLLSALLCLSAESPGWNRLSDKEPEAIGGLGLKREMERDCRHPPTSPVKMTNMSQYQNDLGIDGIGSSLAPRYVCVRGCVCFPCSFIQSAVDTVIHYHVCVPGYSYTTGVYVVFGRSRVREEKRLGADGELCQRVFGLRCTAGNEK